MSQARAEGARAGALAGWQERQAGGVAAGRVGQQPPWRPYDLAHKNYGRAARPRAHLATAGRARSPPPPAAHASTPPAQTWQACPRQASRSHAALPPARPPLRQHSPPGWRRLRAPQALARLPQPCRAGRRWLPPRWRPLVRRKQQQQQGCCPRNRSRPAAPRAAASAACPPGACARLQRRQQQHKKGRGSTDMVHGKAKAWTLQQMLPSLATAGPGSSATPATASSRPPATAPAVAGMPPPLGPPCAASCA